MMAKSHSKTISQTPRVSARVESKAAGLLPPPALNWGQWRAMVNRLKTRRKLSINKLSERSGLDRSTVIELLNGRRKVKSFKIDTLWALAWALEVRPEDFAHFISPLLPSLAK